MLVPQQVSSGIIGDTFDAWWLFFRVWKVKSTPTMARKLQTPSCSKSATPQHYKGLVFTCQLCCEKQTGHWWKEGLARKLIKVMYTLIILLFFWFPPFLPGIFRFWIFHNLSIDINAFFLPCPCFNCWVPICPKKNPWCMSVIYKRLNTCLHSSLTWLDSKMHASLPSQGKEEKNKRIVSMFANMSMKYGISLLSDYCLN